MAYVISDSWREPANIRKVRPTGAEPEGFASDAEMMRWKFATMIAERFGEGGATPRDIYYEIARPLGLSSLDVTDLINGAKRDGYLR